ncbi:hypothetical protein THAR02_03699 [Trichoderma harzianum]|uniref:AAA+ ATPase domain-containing protein n=1 Tax=Trichoderma harzianum TaxID=5544 RepID=A0A0F9XGQ8_TRIHA|nr:hypothetical protein THAR02_03699 [Trichoderma harzianum]
MTTAAVDISSLDIIVSEKVDSFGTSEDMTHPLLGAVIPTDPMNGSVKVQQNNSEMVGTDANEPNHDATLVPKEAPTGGEKVKSTEAQPKSLDSKMDEDDQSREAEKAFLDFFSNFDEKTFSNTRIRDMTEYISIITQMDTKTKSPESLHEVYPSMPDRIRINGEPLRKLLEKALEVDFSSGGLIDSKSSCSVVFLKPYKLFVQNESRIRQIYEQLEQKFADPETQERKAPADDEKSENFLETHGTEQAFKELSCLIEFMDSDLKGLKQLGDATISKVSFSDLWHIFYPGCVVITSQEPINAYRVFYVTGGRSYLSPPEDEEESDAENITKPYRIPDKESDLLVACYQIDFDGKKFGPVSHSFSLQKYDDFRDVTSLPIYPLEFAKKSAKIKNMLTVNGQTFLDVCKGEHVQYRGINLHETEEIDSEVVVDFQAALWDPQDKDKDSGWDYAIQFGIKPPTVNNKAEVIMVSSNGCRRSHCCENEVVFDDLAIDHQRMEDFLTDKSWLTTDLRHLNDNPKRIPKGDLILFPHRLFAFVLKDRKWAVIDVNNVKRVPEPKPEAWQSLVLPEGHKEMVYSIVQSHFRDKKRLGPEDETQTDLIRGKASLASPFFTSRYVDFITKNAGKGLIILLHGAPGVGKTSTAECVAEICKRPLYPITCGDLGITAVEVENRLKRIFVQAQKWKCVLLLDEADVFLSERGNDVKHNSLVSVFLRILEYYQGILFLTTNRVGKIDEAFRSRVHVSLYYPPLDLKSTVDIFKTNLERIKKQKGDSLKAKDKSIERFAEKHYRSNKAHVRWNGRQIRNAFHIAVALAENEAMEESGTSGNDKKPPRATLSTRHFRKVQDTSAGFDNYLTSVIGMGLAERARDKSYRQDTWGKERDNDERDRNSRTRNRRRNERQLILSDDNSSDSTDSTEDDGDVAKKSIESDESSDGKERSKRQSGDETEDSEDGQQASRRNTRDTGKKRSRERDRGSRVNGRSKKST